MDRLLALDSGLSIVPTLEPDGQATGCNPVEVGSTPTGVSWIVRREKMVEGTKGRITG